jgi:adenosylmethionine-8-amino-7-oxononanoate aminotransferase
MRWWTEAGKIIQCPSFDPESNPTSSFSHGHTYQGHPVGCAAALEVQKIMKEENLIENVRINGQYLGELLHKHLDSHPNVGNIRGRGFFWSVSIIWHQVDCIKLSKLTPM